MALSTTDIIKESMLGIYNSLEVEVKGELLKKYANVWLMRVENSLDRSYTDSSRIDLLAFLAYEFGINILEKNDKNVKEYVRLESLKYLLTEFSNLDGYLEMYNDILNRQNSLEFPFEQYSDKEILKAIERYTNGYYPITIRGNEKYRDEYDYLKYKWQMEYKYNKELFLKSLSVMADAETPRRINLSDKWSLQNYHERLED